MSAFSNDEMAMVDDDSLNHALATEPESPPGRPTTFATADKGGSLVDGDFLDQVLPDPATAVSTSG